MQDRWGSALAPSIDGPPLVNIGVYSTWALCHCALYMLVELNECKTIFPALLFCCRWTLLSRRPRILTTWPSCMRGGLPGCDRWAALCLWSSRGLKMHPSPVHLWCLRTSTQPIWWGGWEANPFSILLNPWAPKMEQWPHSTTATALAYPLMIGLTQPLVALQAHLLFRGLSRQSSAGWGDAKASLAWNTFCLTCTASVKLYP